MGGYLHSIVGEPLTEFVSDDEEDAFGVRELGEEGEGEVGERCVGEGGEGKDREGGVEGRGGGGMPRISACPITRGQLWPSNQCPWIRPR